MMYAESQCRRRGPCGRINRGLGCNIEQIEKPGRIVVTYCVSVGIKLVGIGSS
jgi:hypothetical protein